ncbi:MAG: hypothetical protein QOE36_1137 [Gaiellaceae bacterium]|nr:hypothetical protein [Gaiellaceae bacterium]
MSAPQLPGRYAGWSSLRDLLDRRVESVLVPEMTVLDVGAGRRPTILPEERPSATAYVGLDVELAELTGADPGSYDEAHAGSVVTWVPAFESRFDLVVSCYAFEHVKPMPEALENIRRYLRPGGMLIALFSGSFSAHAVANRVLPEAVAARLIGREPETKFRAHYDRCWYGALERDLASWSAARISPLYLGAPYFAFSPALRRAYVAYENVAARQPHRNLASHYLLEATR